MKVPCYRQSVPCKVGHLSTGHYVQGASPAHQGLVPVRATTSEGPATIHHKRDVIHLGSGISRPEYISKLHDRVAQTHGASPCGMCPYLNSCLWMCGTSCVTGWKWREVPESDSVCGFKPKIEGSFDIASSAMALKDSIKRKSSKWAVSCSISGHQIIEREMTQD